MLVSRERRMKRAILLTLSVLFGVSYIVTSLLDAPNNLSGLSTMLGTTMLGTTVLSLQFVSAISSIQLYLSLTCLGVLVYLELSDPRYGATAKALVAVRQNWIPFAVFLAILFFLIVGFKVASILGF